MVINKVNGNLKSVVLKTLILASVVWASPICSYSGEMPTNPQVQSGKVTITGTGTNHLQVNTKTNLAGHGAGSKKRGFKKALGSRRALFSLRLGLRVNE